MAEVGGDLVGAVIAYTPPGKPTTLFVWQVAVAERARGQGLGLRMLKDILCRISWWRLNCVQTTITEDNAASWALFESLAKALNAPYEVEPLFDRDRHFAGAHPTEYQMTVAPLAATHLSSLRLKRSKAHVR